MAGCVTPRRWRLTGRAPWSRAIVAVGRRAAQPSDERMAENGGSRPAEGNVAVVLVSFCRPVLEPHVGAHAGDGKTSRWSAGFRSPLHACVTAGDGKRLPKRQSRGVTVVIRCFVTCR